MCFSTEASFTAAALLAAGGTSILRSTTSRAQVFLAAIPFLFALQQLSEGIVWLHFSHNIGSGDLFMNAQRFFLTFAFFIWPIWIPLSLAVLETVSWRRAIIFIFLFAGLGLSLVNLSYAVKDEMTIQVVNHSLQYDGKIPNQMIIYPLIILAPMFLSSLRSAWIFGILVTIAYVLADYFYTKTFVSVWCFFSAIVSLCVYKILKDNQYSLRSIPKG